MHACLISRRLKHHAGHSGYDRIADFMPGSTVLYSQKHPGLPDRILARAGRRWIKGSKLRWYHRQEFAMETRLMIRRFWRPNEIIHFLYGENSFRYLGQFKQVFPGYRLVATFHTPPERFHRIVERQDHIAALDAAIIVSSIQAEYLVGILPQERIHYVPHGIDTDYYKPSPLDSFHSTGRFLCVGSHLRNFVELHKIADEMLRHAPDARIVVVGAGVAGEPLASLRNVELKKDIDDQKLVELYQTSDALLMPLTDSTANNTLLEALSCGLPIVTTDLPGTRDYLDNSGAALVSQGNIVGFVKSAIEFLKTPAKRRATSVKARQRAKNFEWKKVAKYTQDVYKTL